jgi:hypothetical protein
MRSSQEHATGPISSEALHNQNCFLYLKRLKLVPALKDLLGKDLYQELVSVQNTSRSSPERPYADLYTKFFSFIDEHVDSIYASGLNKVQKRFMDELVLSCYDNDNGILAESYAQIRGVTLQQRPIAARMEKQIERHVKDHGPRVNKQALSPAKAGASMALVKATFAADYKPQHGTSLSTIRHYDFHRGTDPKEYRFGTQGQRHHGQSRVSPLFNRFLKIKEERSPRQKIAHIYFNNLGRDRTGLEGTKEKAMTAALEALELFNPKVAVITLPADLGIMDKNSYKKTKPTEPYRDTKKMFLDIAMGRSSEKVQDFHISPRIREMLFKNEQGVYSPQVEEQKMSELIERSFQRFGITDRGVVSDVIKLTPAHQQAIWAYFIKFELTDHIISQLKPAGINFSCKDAIDRGGISSAIYNLMKSISRHEPMSRDEFEQALHAAPTMVKGRGMNHHLEVAWNMIDVYINKRQDATIAVDPIPDWLIEWRDANCPHARVDQHLAFRILECQSTIDRAIQGAPGTPDEAKIPLFRQAQGVLARIANEHRVGVSGKRLLLEAAVLTTSLALTPNDQEPLQRYDRVTQDLSVNYPRLKMLVGALRAFVGFLLSPLRFGREQRDTGAAVFKSGRDAKERGELQTSMAHMIDMKRDLGVIRHRGEEAAEGDTDEMKDTSSPSINPRSR